MIDFYVWTCYGEWAHWCRCRPEELDEIREMAARSGIDCDWLAW